MDTMQAPDPEWDIGWSGQNPHGTFAVTTPSVHSGGSHVNGEVIVEFGLSCQVKKLVFFPDRVTRRRRLNHNEIFVVQFFHGDQNPEIVVEREMNILTLEVNIGIIEATEER